MEDVDFAFRAAAEYRQTFNHDVVIDLIGYRKMGHNELDQPSFTQPHMYKQVAKMTPVARIYEKQLLDNGTITPEKLEEMKSFIKNNLEECYVKSKNLTYKAEDWITEEWAQLKELPDVKEQVISGISLDVLKDIGKKVTVLPEESKFHKLVKKIFVARQNSIETGKDIDWGTAEALAFSSLI